MSFSLVWEREEVEPSAGGEDGMMRSGQGGSLDEFGTLDGDHKEEEFQMSYSRAVVEFDFLTNRGEVEKSELANLSNLSTSNLCILAKLTIHPFNSHVFNLLSILTFFWS